MRVRLLIPGCCLAVLFCTGKGVAAVTHVADAAFEKNLLVVRSLLQQDADVNGPQVEALSAAVASLNVMTSDVPQAKPDNTLDLVKAILARGANVNARLAAKVPYRGAPTRLGSPRRARRLLAGRILE